VRGNLVVHPTGLGFLTAGIRIADVVSTGRIDLREFLRDAAAVQLSLLD
jgi:hypothetical protein